MHISVHSSTIHKQDMEATWISINRWIKKMWYIYTVDCYLAIRKNEKTSSTATWMRDYHIKWGKSEKERHTPYNITWRRKWRPTPIFLPAEFHGQKSLVSYSPWGCKESDTAEQLIHFHHLYVESKIWHKWAYLQNRNRLPDVETKYRVTKTGGWEK